MFFIYDVLSTNFRMTFTLKIKNYTMVLVLQSVKIIKSFPHSPFVH